MSTHKVRKPLTAAGRSLERGDTVDASKWGARRVKVLEELRYIEPIRAKAKSGAREAAHKAPAEGATSNA